MTIKNDIFTYSIKGKKKRINLGKSKVTLQYDDIVAVQKGSWTKVVIKEGKRWTEFNVRTGWMRQKLEAPRNRYTKSAKELVTRAWQREYKQGQIHLKKKTLEKIKKVYRAKGNWRAVKAINKAIKSGDAAIEKFHDEWMADKSSQEVKEFFSDSPDHGRGRAKEPIEFDIEE